MATPLYNGADIFGPASHVRAWVTPPARVSKGFVGVEGLFTKTLGTRGTEAEAHGILVGVDETSQNAAEFVFYNLLAAGGRYPLLDPLGKLWPDMVLVEFDPGPELLFDLYNGYHRSYRARFLGLSLPS